MTIAEKITNRIAKLPLEQQRVLLQFLDSLPTDRVPHAVVKRRSSKSSFDAALRAVVGIWRDRTDLPTDTVAASKHLRGRLMRRSPRA